MVDKDVKELIEANKATGVDLKYDWEILKDKFAINTISPGCPDNWSSFYDFIIWYTTAHNGVFSYDTITNSYTLSETKEQEGDVFAISELEIADHQIDFPETIRYNDRFLNVFTEDPRKSETDRDTAKEGLRRDFLLREPIASDFERKPSIWKRKNRKAVGMKFT